MEVAERIRAGGSRLTGAERRVAEVILGSPQAVGFGTVAELARAAGVGAATVVRLSSKLGYDGFTELQNSVQRDLLRQLRPAAERIHEASGDPHADARREHLSIEVANVTATLSGVDQSKLERLVDRLSDLSAPVAVLSGDDSAGVARQFTVQIGQIRPDVRLVYGSQVAVHRLIALLHPSTTVIVIDLRRYEQWVLDAHALATARGLWSAALSDNALSPLAAGADVAFDITAGSVGPFDSHVGTLALLNLLVASVAARLRESAGERLEAIEAAWAAHASLVVRD